MAKNPKGTKPNLFTEKDYATSPDFSKRLTINLLDGIMGSLGVKASELAIHLPAIQALANMNPVALQTLGVLGGAAFNAPTGLASIAAKITGADPDSLNDLFQIGTDTFIRSAVGSLQRQGVRSGEIPTDQHIKRVIGDWLDQHRDKIVLVNPLQRQVVVDGNNHVYHDAGCPICAAPKGEGLRPGYALRTLEWADQNGYQPTNGTCCGNAAREHQHALRHAPKEFRQAFHGLTDEQKRQFTDYENSATPEQLKAINHLKQQTWRTSALADMLALSTTVEEFVRKIGTVPETASVHSAFEKFMKTARDISTRVVSAKPDPVIVGAAQEAQLRAIRVTDETRNSRDEIQSLLNRT